MMEKLTLPPLSLVLGGVSSGKSSFAESQVFATEFPRVYIATALSQDAEMAEKISEHLEARGPDWHTIEAPLDVVAALETVEASQVVLLDCATMWLTNIMFAEYDVHAEIDALTQALTNCPAPVIVVSNEIGLGGVSDNAVTRKFARLQGKLNARIAEMADSVVLVAAGQPLEFKAPK